MGNWKAYHIHIFMVIWAYFLPVPLLCWIKQMATTMIPTIIAMMTDIETDIMIFWYDCGSSNNNKSITIIISFIMNIVFQQWLYMGMKCTCVTVFNSEAAALLAHFILHSTCIDWIRLLLLADMKLLPRLLCWTWSSPFIGYMKLRWHWTGQCSWNIVQFTGHFRLLHSIWGKQWMLICRW